MTFVVLESRAGSDTRGTTRGPAVTLVVLDSRAGSDTRGTRQLGSRQ